MKSSIFKIVTLFILVLMVCPVWGQASNKMDLTPEVYDQWHTIHSEQLSGDSKWFSYSLLYAHDIDTTFVEDVRGSRKYIFPNAQGGKFSGNWYSCLRDGVLNLLQLEQKKQIEIPNVWSYSVTSKDIVVVHVQENGVSSLIILNKDGREMHNFSNVKHYYLDAGTSKILLEQKYNLETTLTILDLNKGTTAAVYEKLVGDIFNLTWEAEGDAFAFLLSVNEQQTLHAFSHPKQKKFKLKIDSSQDKSVFKGKGMMHLVQNSEALLFWLTQAKVPAAESLVNVWNALDDDIVLRRQQYGRPARIFGKWNLKTGDFQLFENSELQVVSPDGLFAIRVDKKPYLPSIKETADADFYLVNLQLGTEQLLLQKYDGLKTIVLVPDGSGLLYFKDSNWWHYKILDGTHTNMTSDLEACFVNDMFNYANENAPISSPIFIDRSNSFLLYDNNDVWFFDGFNKKPVRLTKGHENELVYRVADLEIFSSTRPFWILGTNKHIPQAFEIVLRIVSSDFSKYGFGFLQKNLNISNIRMFDKEIKLKSLSKTRKSILYTEERVDQAPKLMLWTMNKNKTTVLHQTNVQQRKYHWSASKFIDYKTKDGKPVKGVLFYPANYNPKLYYPMLVYIYQQQGYSYHRYVNPSLYNSDGFNTTHFTSRGYFVFRPDIIYTITDPGISALDCVQSGVQAVLENYNVDPKKIGLIGHSFGGYETNFILTHTSIFSAAVSGSSITDLTSKYFSLLEGNLLPGYERFELLQFRMGSSLFDNRNAYRRNSPIEFVENITTPLLSWTGEKDTQVDPFQSMEFYIALRRLKKRHIMLTYPDENHVLIDRNRQKDLCEKIDDWFGYWLKNESVKSWMAENYGHKLR